MHLMKKVFCWCLLMVMVLISGCSKRAAEGVESDGSSDAREASSSLTFPKADIDFTRMNYNMISGKLFDVLIDSQKYLGKTIRFKGQYFPTREESLGVTMHSVLIYDATACCQTGLQFELINSENIDESELYPSVSENIEIFGKLRCKEINGMDYFYVECERFVPAE